MPRRSEVVTYVLLASALGLGVYVFGVDRGKPTTSEQTARAGMLLRVWRAEDVTRATITRKNERIELVLEGDQWKMTSPRNARADFLAVTSLLNALGGARAERAVGAPSAQDRKTFGLDAPRSIVEVAMKGVTLKVSLGASVTGDDSGDASTASSSYVEVAPYGDDKGGVFVVPAEVARALDRSSDAYREPSLVASHQSMIFSRVAVAAHDGLGVVLERGAHGSFRLAGAVPGGTVRADADAVNGLFAAFGGLKADPFVDDATPVDVAHGGTVDVALKGGGALHLAYGGACPVGGPQLVVVQLQTPERLTGCVPRFIVDRLEKPASEYVDGHAFGLLFGTESAKISEIEAVTIEASGKKVLDAERRAGGMHLRVPSDEQADGETSARFLRALASVSGVVVEGADPSKVGLSSPAGRVTIRRRVDPMTLGESPSLDGGAIDLWEQTVDVSAPIEVEGTKKKAIYLRRQDDGAILRVALEDAVVLGPGAALSLRAPNLLDVAADSIDRVATTSSLPSSIPYELSRPNAAAPFQVTTPPLGADIGAILELTRTLSSLTCLRWAGDRDDGSFGFATPTATISVHRQTPNLADSSVNQAEFVIEVGDSAKDGVYARVKGRDPICVLPQAAIDALQRPPVDRTLAAFDPMQTPRVVVTRPPSSTRVVAFDGKLWRDGSDAGTETADALARKLGDLVVSLRTERVLHLGPATEDEGFGAPTLTIEGFDGATRKKRVRVGSLGKIGATTIYHVRVDGIEATYAMLRDDVDKLLAF